MQQPSLPSVLAPGPCEAYEVSVRAEGPAGAEGAPVGELMVACGSDQTVRVTLRPLRPAAVATSVRIALRDSAGARETAEVPLRADIRAREPPQEDSATASSSG
eukprot:m51a1_g11104 hypothetical protein (104) ;mRNA; r:58407-60044